MSDTHMKEETTIHAEKEVAKSDVALREEEILKFWKERDIFNKTVLKDAPHGEFVFYDGPPFATGTPHYGHILAGTIKDAIPRFWTMQGYRVKRKWGWDCHGLPLENIIEKRLGLATKRDIEAMGIQQFNEAAREAVMEYESDWKEVVPRMGRFVDMDDDYKTMDTSYTESVWWVFNELNKKGLVYEGYKSMHLCPRCGTTLSNFEVNQGYKDIKDIAVFVELPFVHDPTTALLVWTTTPWTLPGNMAAAIHRDIVYVKARIVNEADGHERFVILAKERAPHVLAQVAYTIVDEFRGEKLIGTRYTPPFDVFEHRDFPDKEHAWSVYHADYVEVGDAGTGAVHIAPAYGEEDMVLAQQERIPIVHHVGTDGRFCEFVTHFAGQLVKPKDDDTADVSHLDADIEIVKRLKDAGKLFAKENITHSYPHCWRCDTPLLNYATTSWFVRVTEFADKLVAQNNTVRWVPEHVGRARFGNWLEGARDWAVSRQRYWGAPLPIWKRVDGKGYKVFGSFSEISEHIPQSKNLYFLLRHGESLFNTQGILNGEMGTHNPLTDAGKAQVRSACETLKASGIEMIYYSPLERTEETARIIAEELGISESNMIADERLREMRFGIFEGKSVDAYHGYFASGEDRLTVRPEGGETWTDVKKRVGDFLYEIDARHEGKRILIVSHNGTMQMLLAAAHGDEREVLGKIIDADTYDLANAEVRPFVFKRIPHNDIYELDFHRPYIDGVELQDIDGTAMVRVPDVFDCWFESGSMPYGQHHYPFENSDVFDPAKHIGYPAQFIAEGLDQTRGWFYSLIVLGTALFGKTPFENVIVSGLVLAEDGKKMSKSLRNYPDPMELANRIGVDAMRYYLLSSPVIRGEDLSFSEKEALEQQRKNIGRLHNVLAMYEQYQEEPPIRASSASTHVLDQWIIARVHEANTAVTQGYINYELDRATRPIEMLIDDLSVWYLRRSRERIKGDDVHERHATLGTLRYVLKSLALMMAPVMPFYAEYLFLRVRESADAESVHLMPWLVSTPPHDEVIAMMQVTRDIVARALEARAQANIKVRQPLACVSVHRADPLPPEFTALIADEVNVKEVRYDASQSQGVVLDTTVTPELKREGNVRELIRAVQDARKELMLTPREHIRIHLAPQTETLVGTFRAQFERTVGAREVRIDASVCDRELMLDGVAYRFGIERME